MMSLLQTLLVILAQRGTIHTQILVVNMMMKISSQMFNAAYVIALMIQWLGDKSLEL